jgi:hypothetical protein
VSQHRSLSLHFQRGQRIMMKAHLMGSTFN